MTLIIEWLHKKYGNAIIVKDNTLIKSAAMSCNNDIDISDSRLRKNYDIIGV